MSRREYAADKVAS